MSAISLSRRLMLGNVMAGMALAPSLVRAAAPASSAAPPAGPAQQIQGATDDRDRMTVETMINGKGPFHFVVDTGADRSVVSDDVAQALGLPFGDNMLVEGIARSIPAPSVRLEKLQVGWLEMNNLALPTLPRALLGLDGYLGLDVVDRQAVTYDFMNKRLDISPSNRITDWMQPTFNRDVVRVGGGQGRVTAVGCSVENVPAYAFVDSGAEISIGNAALFDKLAQRGTKYIENYIVNLVGVTGGSVQGRMTAIDQIKMGTLTFANSTLVISDLPIFKLWGLQERPALFIGMNFLRNLSAVTIDYGRRELRMKLAEATTLMARRA